MEESFVTRPIDYLPDDGIQSDIIILKWSDVVRKVDSESVGVNDSKSSSEGFVHRADEFGLR